MIRRRHWKSATDEAAKEHLQRVRWGYGYPHCTNCLEADYAVQPNGRYRCRQCGHRFSDFSRTWMEIPRLTHRQWLVLVDMFVRRHSTRQIAEELGVSYKSAFKGTSAVRLAILNNSTPLGRWSYMRDLVRHPIDIHDPAGQLRIEHWNVPEDLQVYHLSSSGSVDYHASSRVEDVLESEKQFILISGKYLFTDPTPIGRPDIPTDSLVFPSNARLLSKYQNRIFDHRDYLDMRPSDDFARYVFHRTASLGRISTHWFPVYLAQFSFEFRNQGRGKADTILKYLCQNPLMNWHYLRELRHDQPVWRALKRIYRRSKLSILLGTDHPNPIQIPQAFNRLMPTQLFPELFELETSTQHTWEASKRTAPTLMKTLC